MWTGIKVLFFLFLAFVLIGAGGEVYKKNKPIGCVAMIVLGIAALFSFGYALSMMGSTPSGVIPFRP